MRPRLCVSVFSMGRQVGVVGRTGAGKTSLWGVLLRLMTSTQGAVLIDDVDTRTVPCHELRKRIAVMPQVGQHCSPPPHPPPPRKVAGSYPRRSGGRIFISRVDFLC